MSQRWTRGDKIGVGSLVVAIIAVALAILTPEIRQATHLDTTPESAHVSVEQSRPQSFSDTKTGEDRLKAPRVTRKDKPASQTSTFTQNCGGGNCAISTGQTGGITAGNINIGTIEQRIPKDKKAEIIALLSKQKAKASGATLAMSTLCRGGNTNLANDWNDVLNAAGWSETASPTEVSMSLKGVVLGIPTHQFQADGSVHIDPDSPVGDLLKAAAIAHIKVQIVKGSVLDGIITVYVGRDPD